MVEQRADKTEESALMGRKRLSEEMEENGSVEEGAEGELTPVYELLLNSGERGGLRDRD